jgi:hypothetical protein
MSPSAPRRDRHPTPSGLAPRTMGAPEADPKPGEQPAPQHRFPSITPDTAAPAGHGPHLVPHSSTTRHH